ncbi:MAG: tetratricopeptide repeat protein [Myxococcota bacterium]
MTPTDEARWDAVEDASEAIAEGSFPEAVALLEETLRDDPGNAYASYFLGNAQFELGKFDRSLKAFVRALEVSPDYIGAMIGAGQSLRMLGQHDKAIRMGKQILARRKDDGDALYLLGMSHFARGDSHAAATYLERFLTTSPELEVATEVRGVLQVLAGEVLPSVDEGSEQ